MTKRNIESETVKKEPKKDVSLKSNQKKKKIEQKNIHYSTVQKTNQMILISRVTT